MLAYCLGWGLFAWCITRGLTAALPATRGRSAVWSIYAASATTIYTLLTRF